MNDYVESVREVERRIRRREERRPRAAAGLERPMGMPSVGRHVALLSPMQWLAFGLTSRASRDVHRWGGELNFRTIRRLAVTEGNHGLSHHGAARISWAKYAR